MSRGSRVEQNCSFSRCGPGKVSQSLRETSEMGKYLSRETLPIGIFVKDMTHAVHLSTDLVTPASRII